MGRQVDLPSNSCAPLSMPKVAGGGMIKQSKVAQTLTPNLAGLFSLYNVNNHWFLLQSDLLRCLCEPHQMFLAVCVKSLHAAPSRHAIEVA